MTYMHSYFGGDERVRGAGTGGLPSRPFFRFGLSSSTTPAQGIRTNGAIHLQHLQVVHGGTKSKDEIYTSLPLSRFCVPLLFPRGETGGSLPDPPPPHTSANGTKSISQRVPARVVPHFANTYLKSSPFRKIRLPGGDVE